MIGAVLLAGFSAAAQEMPKEEPLYVSEEIIYRDIDGIEDVQQTAWIMVRDPESGKRVRRLLPLETVSYLNEQQEESEKSGSRKNTVDCRAVYGGLIARENAEALPDLKGEYSSKEYSLGMDVQESQNENRMIWLIIPVILGVILLIWAWKMRHAGYMGRFCLLVREKSLIIGIFLAIFAVSGAVYTGKSLKEYKTAAASYENIRKEAGITSQDIADPVMDIDEEKLKEINPDYSFWIRIPKTAVDYPVVWGAESGYYLDHGFNREKQTRGSIFADSGRIPFVSANTIVYGHNMKDGTMFSDLKKYKDPDFAREHPYIEIYHHGKWLSCPVIASKIIEENEVTPYQNGTEKILTLSTCYGKTKRMVVQARIEE